MAAKKKVTKTAPKKAVKKTATRKSYTGEFKAKVVAFAKAQGRGGQTAAAKKFGVSPISVGQWVKKAGGGKIKKTAGQAKKAAKVASKGRSISAIAKDLEKALQQRHGIDMKVTSLKVEMDNAIGSLS